MKTEQAKGRSNGPKAASRPNGQRATVDCATMSPAANFNKDIYESTALGSQAVHKTTRRAWHAGQPRRLLALAGGEPCFAALSTEYPWGSLNNSVFNMKYAPKSIRRAALGHSRARFFSLLLLMAASIPPAALFGQTSQPTDRRIEAATERALEWMQGHRATLADGGLADMIDEGVALRFFAQYSHTESQRKRFSQLFREQMASLNELEEFEAWARRPHKPLIEHYHLVLAAHLIQTAGLPSPLTIIIAEQAREALATVKFDSPTVQLTIAAFLLRLDKNMTVDINSLRARSMIEHLSRYHRLLRLPREKATEQQLRAANWWLYALVHEIIALTDFGQLPVSGWLEKRRNAVVEALEKAVTWADRQRNHDLVAELVVTLYFLREPLTPQVQAALHTLLADQKPDGSWGVSTATTRHNKLRHTVLTATAALLAYRAWRQQQ